MIPSPETAFMRLRERVPSYIKWSFVSAIVLGLAAHLYMMTNKLPNHDDVFHLFGCENGAGAGRWLLTTMIPLHGSFSAPWMIGMLSLLALAGTVCLTTNLLCIHRLFAVVVTAALIVAFPAATATFSYLFLADAYFFALFLAAFAAYAVARMPIMGMPLGAIAIILSMGIYQSYFPVAAVLMVGALLFDCLEGEQSFFQIVWRGVKMVGTLALGILVYMAITRWIGARIGGLSDYMGISSMGSISLSSLPTLLHECYSSYRDYFFDNALGWYFQFTHYCIYIAFICGAVLLVTLLLRRRVGFLRGLLALVLVLLYPLAGNIIHVMVGGGTIHDLMIYGTAFVLVLPLALASFACEHADEMGGVRRGLQTVMAWLVLVAMALTSYNYIVTDNKAYLKLEIGLEQIKAYSNRLISAIERIDGYSTAYPVVLVGAKNPDAMLATSPELEDLSLTGILDMGAFRMEYSYGSLLNDLMALPNMVMTEENAEVAAAIGDVRSFMPTYPAEGSVQIVNNYIVVRLN